MNTILIADNKEKINEIIAQMLRKDGNFSLVVTKQENTVKIMEKDTLEDKPITLQDKVIELEDALYSEKKGVLYKSALEVIEKPLIERVLERTEGNQLKAARILGINRNTMRAKVKKLGISVEKWKITI